jgi:hypothetical protein
MVFKISKLRSEMRVGENWKWTVFEVVNGINDVVSDFTTLYIIPYRNPFYLFQVSLASLGCSVTLSLVMSLYSRIKLSWPIRFFIFISGTSEDFGQNWPDKRNSRILLCVQNIPQLAVQSILLYLHSAPARRWLPRRAEKGSQGFTGWDWAILVQTLFFTLTSIFIKLRKLVKDLRGGQEEWIDQETDVAPVVPVLLPGAPDDDTRPWQLGIRGLYQGAGTAGIEGALVSCSLTPAPEEDESEPGYIIHISLYPAPPVFDV